MCILGNESLLPSNGFKVAQHEMDFVDTMVHKIQYIDTQFLTRNQKSPNTFNARKILAEEIVFGILVNNSTKNHQLNYKS